MEGGRRPRMGRGGTPQGPACLAPATARAAAPVHAHTRAAAAASTGYSTAEDYDEEFYDTYFNQRIDVSRIAAGLQCQIINVWAQHMCNKPIQKVHVIAARYTSTLADSALSISTCQSTGAKSSDLTRSARDTVIRPLIEVAACEQHQARRTSGVLCAPGRAR